ncbi:aspartyl-phosphate phosphatase Spo0E family protein [Desulforamulus aeronauticus]|uniref:Spo0E like sporulation regulatory protein n=1 Tax=Desulforamulus aeronauticus DSM 10349 TaxID=1121421 RepID=A0A1M6WEW8_9FIRM|nr:Spo0E like sporulation regulatory protein [Desulforamulus aeronauticus DSM 10349]
MEKLLKEIEIAKKKLPVVVKQYGLSSPEAIRYSQYLDRLILPYQKMLSKLERGLSC